MHGKAGKFAEVLLDGELLVSLPTSDMSKWEVELELTPGRHELEFRSDTLFRINTMHWTLEGNFLNVDWEAGELRANVEGARLVYDAKQAIKTNLRVWISEVIAGKQHIRNRYRREVEWLDGSIGAFVKELRERELYDDTILVFTSDHGEGLAEHNSFGHVNNLYDEMIHVPLTIKPVLGDARLTQLEAGREKLVPHQDLVPTILELAGLPMLPRARGASLLAPDRDPLLISETHKPEAPRNLICFRDDSFKLIFDYDADQFELYDLVVDPKEQTNVFESRRAEREDWVEKLRGIAKIVQSETELTGEVSEKTRELLEALGY